MDNDVRRDKGYRADAAQFFVAAELCRRKLVAVVTLGNCPNTDILVSNAGGTRFCHVQVKTFVPGNSTVSVGMKSQRNFGESFFWILAGIPEPDSDMGFEYFVVPSSEIARAVTTSFDRWANSPGVKGQRHDSSTKIRTLYLPPRTEADGWSLEPFRSGWDRILRALAT
jgi:hypothetical protein